MREIGERAVTRQKGVQQLAWLFLGVLLAASLACSDSVQPETPDAQDVVEMAQSDAGQDAPVETTQDVPSEGTQPGYGWLTGIATFPDGTTPLAQAVIEVEVDDTSAEGTTDTEGEFTINDLPPGDGVGRIIKGIFTVEFTFEIVADGETNIGIIVIDETSAELAVVTGQYDSIESVLEDVGFELHIYEGSDGLLDLADDLHDYDAVFINCDSVFPVEEHPALAASAISSFRQWLDDGGKLYISDWASANAYALDTDMGVYSRFGPRIPVAVPATTIDENLAAAIGEDVMVRFDLNLWAVIVATGANTTVHMRLANEYLSEMTEYDPPGDGLPLMISAPQGDNGGILFFTSFHNEPQATETMQRVLSYVVFFDF